MISLGAQKVAEGSVGGLRRIAAETCVIVGTLVHKMTRGSESKVITLDGEIFNVLVVGSAVGAIGTTEARRALFFIPLVVRLVVIFVAIPSTDARRTAIRPRSRPVRMVDPIFTCFRCTAHAVRLPTCFAECTGRAFCTLGVPGFGNFSTGTSQTVYGGSRRAVLSGGAKPAVRRPRRHAKGR